MSCVRRSSDPSNSRVTGPSDLPVVTYRYKPHFDDDKEFLAARIERLRSSLAHAEQPPSRMRYFISNVEVLEVNDDGLYVRCNLLVYQSRLERTEVMYVGRREDRLRRHGRQWRIARRKVILDQTLVPRTMSTFF